MSYLFCTSSPSSPSTSHGGPVLLVTTSEDVESSPLAVLLALARRFPDVPGCGARVGFTVADVAAPMLAHAQKWSKPSESLAANAAYY